MPSWLTSTKSGTWSPVALAAYSLRWGRASCPCLSSPPPHFRAAARVAHHHVRRDLVARRTRSSVFASATGYGMVMRRHEPGNIAVVHDDPLLLLVDGDDGASQVIALLLAWLWLCRSGLGSIRSAVARCRRNRERGLATEEDACRYPYAFVRRNASAPGAIQVHLQILHFSHNRGGSAAQAQPQGLRCRRRSRPANSAAPRAAGGPSLIAQQPRIEQLARHRRARNVRRCRVTARSWRPRP